MQISKYPAGTRGATRCTENAEALSKRRGPERLPFGAPFHPLNYEISHGKFFSPRAGSSRIPSCRRHGRVRPGATKIDDGEPRRPDTVPRLLIERINQRFHPPAPRHPPSFLPSSLFPLPPSRKRSSSIATLSVYFRRDSCARHVLDLDSSCLSS